MYDLSEGLPSTAQIIPFTVFPSFLPFSCPLPALLLNVESSKHPLGSTSEKEVGHGDRELQRSSVKHSQVSPSLGLHTDLIKDTQIRSCLLL